MEDSRPPWRQNGLKHVIPCDEDVPRHLSALNPLPPKKWWWVPGFYDAETGERTHHDVVHVIAGLEMYIYGEVVSDSVRDHVDECWYDPFLFKSVWR